MALWGALLVLAMPWATGVLSAAVGPDAAPLRHWALAFGGSFVLLLPATAAMGATLPAMQRWVATADRVGRLYAANTAGAMAGALGCAFVLVPLWGLSATGALCALVNLACAVAVWGWPEQAQPGPAQPRAAGTAWALWPLAWTGFLGIGFEVAVVRVLSQVTEDTVYTFALLPAR